VRIRKGGQPLSKARVAEALKEIGIIATVRVPNEQQLLRGIAALTDAGIRAVELPYTTVRGNGCSSSN
jgi:2-keto-3-deoxy-6-phosphogluconate aldolase